MNVLVMVDNSLKLCALCNNVMMIDKSENETAKWQCTLCHNTEEITLATIVSCIRKKTINDNNNPRYMHEKSSALNQVVFRTCSEDKCASKIEKRKACVRKVIYDDGAIGYYCQDCL